MKIIEETGICTCCGSFVEYRYGDENFSLINKDLENYKKYKDFYVFRCPKCGFISNDISGVEGVLFGDIINRSLEFKNALSYKYLKGLDTELYDCHSQEIPANLYEAYSFVCLVSKDYEKYIRSLNKSIELKEIMLNRYKDSQFELGGEEDNDDEYEELYNLIKNSIYENRQQIIFYYTQLERSNVFLDLIYVENLAKVNEKEQAKKVFNELDKKYIFDKDLMIYFKDLIS